MKVVKPFSGPLLGLFTWLLLINSGQPDELSKMAGIGVWMAVWWVFEVISIYFTALIPLILFPAMGIMGMKEVAPVYMHEIIFLFIGGFLIAFAIEKWDLHKRIALKIILSIGATPSRILLGFMLASYLLSMWIMNTSTVMMLLPAVIAVIRHLEEENEDHGDLSTPLLLGLAYAASIGGMATLIGTAPNQYLSGFYNQEYADHGPITFANWFVFGFPVSLVLFTCGFLLLKKMYFSGDRNFRVSLDNCRIEHQRLGPMKYEEKMITLVFVVTVLLWFFRVDIETGLFTIPGWTGYFPFPGFITDSTIAMFGAAILFLIPSKGDGLLLSWEEVKKIPLGVIFLFGGGFALAKGVDESGLSNYLAGQLEILGSWNTIVMVIGLCLFMTFFTELTSNTASTILLLPILKELADRLDQNPLLLMLPVVLSASCAFMLPVATPPNTIVFGSDRLTVRNMARTGFWLNLIGIIIISIAVLTLGRWFFNF